MEESLVAGQIRLLEMVAFCEPLEAILDACLRFCEAHSAEMLTSILILDPDGKHLRHGAAPSLPPEYMRLIDGRAIGPRAGSCGTAAFLAEPVIVEDIAEDPLWEDYREYALPFGLRACWSTPILDQGRRVLGTFAIYYRKPCRPKEDHLQLIRIITHIAGIAILARRMEREKREVFERISDAFVALDNESRFTYVNPKAAASFGRTAESLLGKPVRSEFPASEGRLILAAMDKAMREQAPAVTEEFYPPTARWFEHRIYPSPNGLSIYFMDVTERRRGEEKSRRTEKMTAIGQLASGVAHDFNNQLSIILGYAGLMQNRLADPDLKRFAVSILRAAERSGDLTRNLLTFSRQGHYEILPIDFHDLIGEIAEILAHSIDKRISVVKRLGANPHVVMGDPATLQNALLNLALNARDAMPEGGSLAFATETVDAPVVLPGDESAAEEDSRFRTPGSYLHLTVSDTGTGMTDAVKRRIFEPFFTTKPAGKGTGMGLASVFGTVKNHKGRIAVESAIGRGTAFHLYFPLAPGAVRTEIDSEGVSRPPRNLRLLVVDDEAAIRDLIEDMLKAGGHECLVASGGREALDIYREKRGGIDLVLLDMVMADLDGYQTYRELRRIHPGVRVIISSGFSPDDKVHALMNEGAKGWLQKPYGKAQLDAMMASAMA